MSFSPKVSVLLPVYNCEKFIGEALSSIVNQTFKDLEIFVIDDCSTDRTIQEVEKIKDPRINLIKKKQNTGYTNSLNQGIELAKGEFIARMDGDDISVIDRFEKQVLFLSENPQIMACGSAIKFIPSDQVKTYPTTPDELKVSLLDYCAIVHPSVMIRKSFLEAHNLSYDKNFEPSEDYNLWVQISMKGKLANLPDTLLLYRLHSDQVSSTRSVLQQKNANRCRLFMLLSILDNPSSDDNKVAQFVYEIEIIKSVVQLREIFKWLDNLNRLNSSARVFESKMFEDFVNKRKVKLKRTFFLNRISYSPGILISYFLLQDGVNAELTYSDFGKLIVKCLIFYRVRDRK